MRLIKIRKILKEKENSIAENENSLDEYHSRLKTKLDELLLDVIGVPEAGRHQVNQIIKKAIREEIKEKTAVVAIHEIYKDYVETEPVSNNSENNVKEQAEIENEINNNDELEKLYKNGYR